MIKLICIDLDGTLLHSDLSLSDKNKEAIAKAREQGVQVSIFTGRMFASALAIAQELTLDTPLCTMNGSMVKDPVTEEVLNLEPLGKETLERVLEIVEKYQLRPNFYDEYRMFIGKGHHVYSSFAKIMAKDPRYSIAYIQDHFKYEDMAREYGGGILKGIFFVEGNLRQRLREELAALGLAVVSSSPLNLEITSPRASKGQALTFLAKHLGLDNSQVMVLGDSENDRSMFEVAGFPVAMANATDSIKKLAKAQTTTMDEDGVAKAIEDFVLKDT